ncbi:trypsin-like serine peptidase [Bradyrhizobium sp. PMVTL-01]|uniref:trypsin-like serine peptidase n=1 Tax=Bradyrhizobium sp. PMVTL-01 TaxID=3434999 RepID=UPI003F70DC00
MISRARFPESAEERAERVIKDIKKLGLGPAAAPREVGELESVAPKSPSLQEVERRIEWNLKAASPGATELARAVANKTAREGLDLAASLAGGYVSHHDLNTGQLANLEAVIQVIGRPAWFVEGDAPDTRAATAKDDFWVAYINTAQNAILDICARVGCIMVGSAEPFVPVATGWLIGRNTLVTNAHVAGAVARQNAALAATDARQGWRLRTDRPGVVDFRFEKGGSKHSRFAIDEVLYVEGADKPDLAIFRLKPPTADAAGGMPSPIVMDLKAQSNGWAKRNVFVAGHPIKDLTDDQNVFKVFGELDGTKRFSPGCVLELLGTDVLAHDCSTTNGSSGSPLVDFASSKVVGLHYFGRPGARNEAVLLSAIADHPAIVRSQTGEWGI